MESKAAYIETVNKLKEVAVGRRGWVSLTAESKSCGLPKLHLKIVAEALGLDVVAGHGRLGMCASRKQGAA